MAKWMITGSNGNLGTGLIRSLLQTKTDEVVALVRSERAAADVGALASDRVEVRVLDYTNVQSLTQAAQGIDYVVHLVGILKETRAASYVDAHEASTQALVDALSLAGCQHATYVSIVGSSPQSANACLRSKGAAEQILLQSQLKASVLRVPMVLGQGDYASFALGRRAKSKFNVGFRLASLEQPIFATDVIRAIQQAASLAVEGVLELGGPEVLTRKQLITRAAGVLDRQTRCLSLPVFLGYGMAAVMSLLDNPPLTTAMLGVLDHDDDVDSNPALTALALGELTPLDEMLTDVLGP